MYGPVSAGYTSCVTYLHTQRGFTLAETVVALFIMSLAVAFVTVVASTIKATRDAAYENIAFRVADSKLNELRSLGYAAIAPGAFLDAELANIPNGLASSTVATWNAETKQVTVGVSWGDADARTKYVSLTTLVTETGGL